MPFTVSKQYMASHISVTFVSVGVFMLAWVLGEAFVLKRLSLSRIDSKVLLLIQLPEGEKGIYFVQFTLK